MELLLRIIVYIIGGLVAINLRYYISIHDNTSYSKRKKKIYFIVGNVFVIIVGIYFFFIKMSWPD